MRSYPIILDITDSLTLGMVVSNNGHPDRLSHARHPTMFKWLGNDDIVFPLRQDGFPKRGYATSVETVCSGGNHVRFEIDRTKTLRGNCRLTWLLVIISPKVQFERCVAVVWFRSSHDFGSLYKGGVSW